MQVRPVLLVDLPNSNTESNPVTHYDVVGIMRLVVVHDVVLCCSRWYFVFAFHFGCYSSLTVLPLNVGACVSVDSFDEHNPGGEGVDSGADPVWDLKKATVTGTYGRPVR